MVKMNFSNPVLEKIVRRWKWSRNNTLLLYEAAIEQKILNYTPVKNKDTKHEPHSVLYQFQCIVTTTNTYYRKLINDKNKSFGVLDINGEITKKENISIETVNEQLEMQMDLLERYLKPLSSGDLEKNIKDIMTISDHEYLHQGQLIVLFREAGAQFPERFATAWAIGNK